MKKVFVHLTLAIAVTLSAQTGIKDLRLKGTSQIDNGATLAAESGSTLQVKSGATLSWTAGAIFGGDASAFRTATGLAIGTDVQAYNAGLASIAALSTTSFGRGLLTEASASSLRSTLGLGTADSPTFAGLTAATLTAPSTTDLTLAGGSTGASITLGQGAAANLSFAPTGSGYAELNASGASGADAQFRFINSRSDRGARFRMYANAGASTAEINSWGPNFAAGRENSLEIINATATGSIDLWANGSIFLRFAGARTLSAWGTTGAALNQFAKTYTDSSSAGTVATVVANSFGVPTFAASSVTTFTNAAALYIAGDPSAGANVTLTNSYGLWNVGKSRLDGNIVGGANLTLAGDLAVNGGDITSTGSLMITPGGGGKLNIANTAGASNVALLQLFGGEGSSGREVLVRGWPRATGGNQETNASASIAFGGSTGPSAYVDIRAGNAAGVGAEQQVARFTASGAILLGTTADSANGKLQFGASTATSGGIAFGTEGLYIYRNSTNQLAVEVVSGGQGQLRTSAGSVANWYNGTLEVAPTTPSTSTTTGALKVGGGVGIVGAAYASQFKAKSGNASNEAAAAILDYSAGIARVIGYGPDASTAGGFQFIGLSSNASVGGTRFSVSSAGDVLASSTTDATTLGAGSFVTAGGIYAAKKIIAAGTIVANASSNAFQIANSQTPASSTASGSVGTITWDSSYIYVWTGSTTVKRVALSSY